MRSRQHRGFTLIEVMIALTIGVIILVGARVILNQIADSAARTIAAVRASDHVANTDRAVRALVERTEASDSINVFQGAELYVRFTSWCDVAAGWKERCTALLRVVPLASQDSGATPPTDSTMSALTATDSLHSRPALDSAGNPKAPRSDVPVAIQLVTSVGDRFTLRDSLPQAVLRYLEDPANVGIWRSVWPSGTTTPLAIGIVVPGDTIILRIGERR